MSSDCPASILPQFAHWLGVSCFVFCFFKTRVSLCSPACLDVYSVDQNGLDIREPPATVSQELGLEMSTSTAWPSVFTVLEIKLGPLFMLGKHSCHLSHIPSLLCSFLIVVLSMYIMESLT